MNTISKQILGFYVLLLTLGATVSALVYFNVSSISSATTSLVRVDLPLAENISKLRFAIFAQKPILYEYYADTDKNIFQKKFTDSKDAIKAGLYLIPRDEQGQAFLTQIEFQTAHITSLADKLDQTLSSASIDWDKAREILVEVSATEKAVTPLIDSFVSLNQKHISSIADLSESRMQLIIQLVIGFYLIILSFSVLLGIRVKAYTSR
jgi:hypothetical protein